MFKKISRVDLNDSINNSPLTLRADCSGVRILLVEDEPQLRELIKEDLESFGCLVTTAENGAVALQHVSKVEFDLIITDMQMPGMSGNELINKVMFDLKKNIDCIIITGDHIDKILFDQIAGTSPLVKSILRKPFETEDLKKLILNLRL